MKTTKLSISVLIVLISMFMANDLLAQKARIGKINNNPNSFNNESVTVVGTIEKYEPSTGNTTAYYEIKGDYGNTIRVNTAAEKPETNKRYKVQGTVYINVETGNPFISEKSKQKIGGGGVKPPEEPVEEPVEEPDKTQDEADSGSNNNMIIIIAIIVVAIIIIVLLVTQKKTQKSNIPQEKSGQAQSGQAQAQAGQSKETPSGAGQDTGQAKGESTVKYDKFEGQNTVKVPSAQAGGETRKAIPGELVITKGSEVDKSFKLFGTPTQSGAVCSIGNEAEGWESKIPSGRIESHILVQDPTKTLSRYQAEIIYDGQKTYIKNYSGVNKTVVDSKELEENESVELKGGETIKAGRVEFQYKIS